MAYTPNPADPTEPVDTRPAGTAAEEFRLLKATVAALVIANSAAAGPRHTIVDASRDASGYNNAISAGAGLRVQLTASAAAPYQLTYASGFSGGKAIDYYESITANNADLIGSDLPASNTSYVYRDHGVGYGSTLVPHQEGYAFNRAENSLLHFEEGVTPLDDFGNIYTITGAALTNTKPAYGAKSLDLSAGSTANTNAKRAETAAITSLGAGSWEVSCVVWFDVAPLAAAYHGVFSAVNDASLGARFGWIEGGGNRRAHIVLSSDGTTGNITAGTSGITNLNTGVWYRFRAVYDALGGTYRLYVAAGGSAAAPVWAAEVQEISIASTQRICAVTRVIWGSFWNGAIYNNGMSGYLDEARLIRCATNTSTTTPGLAPDTYPLSITAHKVHWMDIPGKKMYEVTAASTVAGQNPTLTAATRLFLGEADTSGVAITAFRNYAIQGEYVGESSLVTTGQTFNHNIGFVPRIVRGWYVAVSPDTYNPQTEIPVEHVGLTGAGNSRVIGLYNTSKTTVVFRRNSSWAYYDNAGSSFNATDARWKLRIYANRGW